MTDVLGQSDITVLCMPVKTNIQLLPLILDRASGWVTDCGSTKASTSRAVATHSGKARFIPGHPMAGNPVGGLDQARPDLFRDRKWILCPEGADPGGVDTMLQLISGLGASPLLLDAEQHDHSVAWTSHLPQVVASALSVLATEEQARGAAGPGFASATRVAGGEENMWRDIFETNGREIALALQQLGARLSDLGHTLGDGNTDEILQILKEARRLREP
jgi:prephenate dehydrogenase